MKHFLFKKVPKNELGTGTEIAILKKYFDDKLIVDPKDIKTNEGARSYEISVVYNDLNYNYEIKAYETQDYTKDRRLIVKSSDPIWVDRKVNDYLVFHFENLISENSQVTIFILKPNNPLYQKIEYKYKPSNGLELIESDTLFNEILNSFNNFDNNMNNLEEGIPLYTIENKSKYPLNQILFGPPGTGKTDATVEKALEILGLKTDDRSENREIFRSLLNKKIFFVTMHPSYSYEDFVLGLKPKTSDKGELLFEPKPGIFKIVSDLAKKIFEDEGEVIDNEIDNKDILRLCFFLSKFNSKADKKANKYFGSESNGEVFAIVGNRFSTNPNSIKNHRDKFDFLTTEDRKGWQPLNGSNDKLDNTPIWPYHDIYLELNQKSFEEVKDVIKSIEKKKEIKVKRTVENANYVLILDEINRANISKVFGELITLLEEDKRIGKENELSVTLPSGEIFSVPPNLFIIGTMNTADKSIALVDIALRRRFQFIPVYPDSSIITNFCKSADKADKALFMDSLNIRLRVDKGVDFQIGHAYFLKDNLLADVINENVIPLLTEYYRNDLEKVKKLLSDLEKPLDEDYYIKTGLLKYIG
jgi:5-methylcytosine-specific restriction protein B